jgi:aminopeptidase YwaD
VHNFVKARRIALAALILTAAAPLPAQPGASSGWTVKPEWVRAHESFLASDALQGRGSATRDEAIAAAYVASQFEGFGLQPAPTMSGYLQTARIIRPRLNGAPALSVGGAPIADVMLLSTSGASVRGMAAIYASEDVAGLPAADVVIATAPKADIAKFARAARQKKIKLLIVKESDATKAWYRGNGNQPSVPSYFEGAPPRERPTLAVLSADAVDRLVARQAGGEIALTMPPMLNEASTTTNAIGYLPGRDPKAGFIVFSAHLDHLGVRPDGTIMHGANDDASGTTAVLELARALASGKPPRRGILFVCYGSEEIGGYGSRYFGAHPPVPLTSIVANIEFEMIGAQDPKLPDGVMMMTGFERSNLGEALRQQGALITSDPYPEQHFFERSDNYQLALTGVVAHTISGWAVPPTYHQPSDTLESLNIAFMTRAIQSLIAPARWLAESDFQPSWKSGGKPTE